MPQHQHVVQQAAGDIVGISETSTVSKKPTASSSVDKKKLGRNDPCYCGAKKSDGTPIKYKHCHGK